MTRLSRAEQSRANREKILASARQHFERLGYHGASVDAIAEEAGFSKGAIYSQFGSKDDLMLAVLEVSIEDRQRATDRLIDSLEDGRVEDVMRDAFSVSVRSPAWQAALTEFRIHAWRRPELNDRYRAMHERTIAKVAATLTHLFERLGRPSDRPARELAVALLAVNTGLVIEHLAVVDVDVDEFVRTIAELAQSATTEGVGR